MQFLIIYISLHITIYIYIYVYIYIMIIIYIYIHINDTHYGRNLCFMAILTLGATTSVVASYHAGEDLSADGHGGDTCHISAVEKW